MPPVAAARFEFRQGRSNVYGIVHRPMAEVYVRSGRGTWLLHYMFVDSGADFSVLPKSIGEFLGFRKDARDAMKRASGIGGWIWVVMRRTKMRLGRHEFTADVGWAQTDDAPVILGRADVFDRFDVLIRQREKVTEFHWRE